MMTKRKGATRLSNISPEILEQLNSGNLETANLIEGLAIDFTILLSHIVPEIKQADLRKLQTIEGITKKMRMVGEILFTQFGNSGFEKFADHQADTVRGWAAFLLSEISDLTLAERLVKIRILADDHHFAVREWAWLAMRPHVSKGIDLAIELLTPWVKEDVVNIRRFAVEVTRPRGVWCSHIPVLKTQPELGLVLLEPLKTEAEKYVQDSVANWLNDAAKSSPDWVLELCNSWLVSSDIPATNRICKRALRSLKK
ncbi:MAG TPA: DNA alkylation repair protein [Nostocaceae cyanobacterium]|nr:DNA alkylation repair protein [Nostocaceae cyanobacterium]